VQWVDAGGERCEGSLVETVRRVFDDRVPFDLAAKLRIQKGLLPGLEVTPSIERIYDEPHGTALRALLGNVADMDRAQPDDRWLDRHLDRELPEDWLSDLVPANLAGNEEEHARMQQEARETYERALLREERRGTNGIEAAFDRSLMGQLGMRLVEQDSRRREHLLWSHLRVESGEDVTLTIDLELQRLAERVTKDMQAAMAALHAGEDDRRLVEAAVAVIDARSGDVLAYAGAPIVSDAPRDVPGVVWPGNGALGSVVKPMILVEQLESEALGRPHRPVATLQPCAGKYVFGDQRLGCGSAHGASGRDPVEALADSCNTFFFQCAEGLGGEGVARALRRFGLCEPLGPDDPFASCWQPSVRGLAVAKPRVHARTAVPMRAVGYGVEASPLTVARAYAVFATGALPTLGLDLGGDRPRISFAAVESELEVARAGLAACVQSGTARHIGTLREFGVFGKTGTAEVGQQDQNNAWFAGYLPWTGRDAQICFCSVVYWVADQVHGGDAAGRLVGFLLDGMRADSQLEARYLQRETGR
jgi:cell division protein FtsI/penicillin-binding protein 2